LLVALDNVYAVLRSEEPLEPAKVLLGNFAQDFVKHAAGTPLGLQVASLQLKRAGEILGAPALPPDDEEDRTWVDVDHIEPLLASEPPRSDANVAATELLRLAIRMRRERSWSRVERSKALIALCQKVAAANEHAPLDTPAGLQAIRAIIREEVSRAGLGMTINQVPPFDAASLREIVAGEVRAGVAAAGRDRWSSEPLSDWIEKFLAAQYPAEEGKSKVGSKHRQDVENRLAAFLLFSGDKPVRDVTREDLKAYRDILDRLPDRFEARFNTKDMRLAIEKNAERKTPHPTIGPTTVDLKWLGPVDRLFGWLALEQQVEKNPVNGVRSSQEAGEAANTKRLPFKPDQISKIFAITSGVSSKTALYWLPLLMLTTGARPNELAQLRTDDLQKNFNDRAHLNVLCLLDDDDEAAEPAVKAAAKKDPRRVKTAAGRRMIPLHPILVQAGIIEFIEGRDKGGAKQLFRELRPDQHGFWSAAITKRLNRIIRQKLRITNPRYSAYSLRHSFIDACKTARIAEETRMKFVGHQLSGVHGVYGNPHVLPHESALIDSVRFDGIDFARYSVRANKC
jgi:integrase